MLLKNIYLCLWRGSLNFKMNSRPRFTIILKAKIVNFKTRYLSPLIEWVLASVYPIFSKLFWEAFAPCFTLRETLRQLVHRTAFLEDFVWSCWTRKISFLFYKRIQIQNIGFIEVNSLGKEIQERCVLVRSRPKSLYRSRADWHFYGTENEIWAGFGLVRQYSKKSWANYEQVLRASKEF